MNHNFKDIDFKNNIFEYAELIRIIRDTTTDTLITLQKEVNANDQLLNLQELQWQNDRRLIWGTF